MCGTETETLNTVMSEAVSLRAALSDKVEEAVALSVTELLFVTDTVSFDVVLCVAVNNWELVSVFRLLKLI